MKSLSAGILFIACFWMNGCSAGAENKSAHSNAVWLSIADCSHDPCSLFLVYPGDERVELDFIEEKSSDILSNFSIWQLDFNTKGGAYSIDYGNRRIKYYAIRESNDNMRICSKTGEIVFERLDSDTMIGYKSIYPKEVCMRITVLF